MIADSAVPYRATCLCGELKYLNELIQWPVLIYHLDITHAHKSET